MKLWTFTTMVTHKVTIYGVVAKWVDLDVSHKHEVGLDKIFPSVTFIKPLDCLILPKGGNFICILRSNKDTRCI